MLDEYYFGCWAGPFFFLFFFFVVGRVTPTKKTEPNERKREDSGWRNGTTILYISTSVVCVCVLTVYGSCVERPTAEKSVENGSPIENTDRGRRTHKEQKSQRSTEKIKNKKGKKKKNGEELDFFYGPDKNDMGVLTVYTTIYYLPLLHIFDKSVYLFIGM